MAEQINKNDYINHPDRIGGFNYYSLPLVENIDLDYIRFTVEPILRSKIKGRMGHDGQNEFTKLPGGTIERVKISIPIKEDGSFDLEAQQEIANKYRKIQQINSSIYQQIDELINIKIAL